MIRRAVLAAAAAAALACSPQPQPTSTARSGVISDQDHSRGTPGFLFLAPMVNRGTPAGALVHGLAPVVTIAELGVGGRGALATFAAEVKDEPDHYLVNWDTRAYALDPARTYRIAVTVGGFQLGFADVDVVESASLLKNVETSEYIPLQDGRTLPIKFWIDARATLCVGKVCAATDPCHVAGTCDPFTGACSNPPAPEGTACDDGDLCTRTDACHLGACVGADPVLCSPLDACHVAGACDPRSGLCSDPAAPEGTACDDGDLCTRADACHLGACVGADPVKCSALDACHDVGVCDSWTGFCSAPPMPPGTPCDDGNRCTRTDVCIDGACTGTAPVVCAAAGPCRLAGTCDPASGACSDPAAPDGTACDDGDRCTRLDACVGGACAGADPVACATLGDCDVVGACDPASGVCSHPPKPDGTACDDGSLCTGPDACRAGVCAGAPRTCPPPEDPCQRAVACDALAGCRYDPVEDGTTCVVPGRPDAPGVCQDGTCGIRPRPGIPRCPGGGFGDPHLVTLDGVMFDLQSTGDFELTTDPPVQARFEAVGQDVSAITAIGTRLGAHAVTFTPREDPPFRVDGAPTAIPAEGLFLGAGRIDPLDEVSFQITFPPGDDTADVLVVERAAPSAPANPVGIRMCPRRPPGAPGGLLGGGGGGGGPGGGGPGGTLGCDALVAATEPARVAPPSLLDALGPVSISLPSAPATTAGLDAAVVAAARAACQAAGVTDAALLEACVLDVGLTGDPAWAGAAAGVEPPASVLAIAPATVPITFPVPAFALAAGTSTSLAPAATGADGRTVPVVFTSSNPAVAEVDPLTGVVTAKRDGVATVTARTCGGTGGTTTVVHGSDPGSALVLTSSTGSGVLSVGQQLELVATFNTIYDPPATLDTTFLVWRTPDPQVATVNGGVVTAVGPGTVTLTAELPGGLTASFVLVVNAQNVALPPPPGSTTVLFTHVNDAGIAVGYSTSGTAATARPFWWDGELHALPLLPGATACQALAINRPGAVVGFCSTPAAVGVRWDPDGSVTQLAGVSQATDINDAGDMAGQCPVRVACRIHATGAIDRLPALSNYTPSAIATSISDGGAIVGWSNRSYGYSGCGGYCISTVAAAFLSTAGTTIKDLGYVSRNPTDGSPAATMAAAINAAGDMLVGVGYTWDGSVGPIGLYAVPTLWKLTGLGSGGIGSASEVTAVNDQHVAVGSYTVSGVKKAFITQAGTRVLTLLPPLAVGKSCVATSLGNVDANGYVTVVGWAYDAAGKQNAMRWYVRAP